jgi:uncharacterized OB-fold protein
MYVKLGRPYYPPRRWCNRGFVRGLINVDAIKENRIRVYAVSMFFYRSLYTFL